jgi:hypothetical protein
MLMPPLMPSLPPAAPFNSMYMVPRWQSSCLSPGSIDVMSPALAVGARCPTSGMTRPVTCARLAARSKTVAGDAVTLNIAMCASGNRARNFCNRVEERTCAVFRAPRAQRTAYRAGQG